MKLKRKKRVDPKTAMKSLIRKAKNCGISEINITIMEMVSKDNPTMKEVRFYRKMIRYFRKPIPVQCTPVEN